MGLYRRNGGTSVQQFDDVTVWLDNDEDGILDADDDVQVADDFNSGTITLSYDDAGNLTADGVYQYVYDAWNRLIKVQRVAAGDTTTIAEYAYDGQNRRTVKTVSHCGPEATPHDGGDTAVHFYYDRQWRIVETRDGSSQATAQYVWGTGWDGRPARQSRASRSWTSTATPPRPTTATRTPRPAARRTRIGDPAVNDRASSPPAAASVLKRARADGRARGVPRRLPRAAPPPVAEP